MVAFWALMHLVAASLVMRQQIDCQDAVDAHFIGRELEYDEACMVTSYAMLLGMASDSAWALALCRGDRREAFGE